MAVSTPFAARIADFLLDLSRPHPLPLPANRQLAGACR